ncbi:MAG: biopolymer transporter ExbD [Bdellovibrionaceae bacterium]|nr:biopolymer transporter ExbD [Pseudobdellovibrionaceae bacterium]MDW8191047.1 biopolymer transporter ExbD [Pseudobdellovibrionaceae bacterium]
MDSFLQQTSILKISNKVGRKWFFEGLMLTSLIDAFSILVIFLILTFSNSEQFLILSSDIELPSVRKIDELKKNTVIKISKEGIYVGEKLIQLNDLTQQLLQIRKEWIQLVGDGRTEEIGVIIQADKKTPFSAISPVIAACSQIGFSQLHFAVLQQ